MTALQGRWILCGGLASGKSMVRRLLGEAGTVTIDADAVGHGVLEPNGPAFEAVAARWPSVVVHGRVDRQALAEIAFNDPCQLVELESITHPHIFDQIRTRVEEVADVVVVEVPVLSNGLGPGWSRLVVDCKDDLRLRRAIGRGMSEADARARMASQPSRNEWLAVADLVIPNHRSEDHLSGTVARVVEKLRMLGVRQ